jgi:hypothetical protein
MTEGQADEIIDQLTSIVRLLAALAEMDERFEGPSTIAEGMKALTDYEKYVD